ncbi:MAG: hypothetical protein IIA51_00640 [Chloroflexi bacterium]|nr:hypothetical protein [Chloroflexota bacterium]MDK1044348.1 hypothetical protein [Anaerolineales bacterium]MCH8340051.1 hypothetical protein [Chloroflexota bacterium]MCI0772110.1 hypothetical protein [Chloroflexota bacterium]MCI0805468.1 hypothetical protein [Chloroflexota bacterium]
MKRKLIIVVIVMLIALVTAFPAFADDRGPCNNSGGPGHSDYAKHRIVSLAKDGMLGNDGHKPGVHQGFSFCP